MRRLTLILTSAVLAFLMAAGVSTIAPPAAEAAGGGKVKRCGGGKIFLNATEKATFHQHNKIRKNRNLKPFCVHPRLQRAARAHSKDMVQRNYFSHRTKGKNEDAGARLKRFGYRWRLYGENISGGNGAKGSPKNVMRRWMNSPGHRANILDRRFREIGIGTYTGTYKSYQGWTMYTVDFGTRR